MYKNKIIPEPFYRTNEKDLQWIGETPWVYRNTFEIDQSTLKEENINLVFEGLDTYSDVYLNDILILKADNMYRTWTIDCKKILKQGKNILTIKFWPPQKYSLENFQNLQLAYNPFRLYDGVMTRKAPYHYGWDWGPIFITCGIWRPVYIETWNPMKLEDVNIVQKI